MNKKSLVKTSDFLLLFSIRARFCDHNEDGRSHKRRSCDYSYGEPIYVGKCGYNELAAVAALKLREDENGIRDKSRKSDKSCRKDEPL